MPRSRTTVVTFIALVLISLGVSLYVNSRRAGYHIPDPPPPQDFLACKLTTFGDTCFTRCAPVPGFPPYTKFSQAISDGTADYCCPDGTTFVLATKKCHPTK
jgi:hypothetical protein